MSGNKNKEDQSSMDAADDISAEKAANALAADPFKVTGMLANDLEYLCKKIEMTERQVIATAMGILMKAEKIHGEIHIVDENRQTVYRTRKIGV